MQVLNVTHSLSCVIFLFHANHNEESTTYSIWLTAFSRKRRIKCDEGKPRCVQCTSSLRRCEGYQSPQAWLFKPRASPEAAPGCKALALAEDTHTPLVHSISPLASVGGSKEKRFFQLWMEQAAPVFSCYFGTSESLFKVVPCLIFLFRTFLLESIAA